VFEKLDFSPYPIPKFQEPVSHSVNYCPLGPTAFKPPPISQKAAYFILWAST
jgi:hypothetical protein